MLSCIICGVWHHSLNGVVVLQLSIVWGDTLPNKVHKYLDGQCQSAKQLNNHLSGPSGDNCMFPYFKLDASGFIFLCKYVVHFDDILKHIASPDELVSVSSGPFYYYGLTLIPAWISNHMPIKCGMEILIHYLTSTVAPFKFRNG